VLQHRNVMAGNSKIDVDEPDRVGKHASRGAPEASTTDRRCAVSSSSSMYATGACRVR
jgi:hypothetical protein